MFDLIKNLEERVATSKELLEHAYADGNSDSDYLEGLIDGYEVSLFMARQLEEEKHDRENEAIQSNNA